MLGAGPAGPVDQPPQGHRHPARRATPSTAEAAQYSASPPPSTHPVPWCRDCAGSAATTPSPAAVAVSPAVMAKCAGSATYGGRPRSAAPGTVVRPYWKVSHHRATISPNPAAAATASSGPHEWPEAETTTCMTASPSTMITNRP